MKQRQRMLQTTLQLLKYHTYSGNERIMQDFVLHELQTLGFKTKIDKIGNIYATRGKAESYPLLNAHMDIVYDIDDKLIKLVRELVPNESVTVYSGAKSTERLCTNCENIYDCASLAAEEQGLFWQKAFNALNTDKYTASNCPSYLPDSVGYNSYYSDRYDTTDRTAYYTGLYGYSLSEDQKAKAEELLEKKYEIFYDPKLGRIKSNKLRIMGGDDKCGISIALQTAREMPRVPMKILFTVQEESGCIGVEYFTEENSAWLNDVKYSITIDRRDNDNLLMYSSGRPNCSAEFAALLAKIGIMSGISVKMDHGTIADVIELRKFVKETVNISAGYHNPHTVDEYVDFDAMWEIKNWIKNIVAEV